MGAGHPHFVVLFFLAIAYSIVTMVAFFAVLCTARYPRTLFEFNVGVMRWAWRVSFYSFVLGTDKYPPFSLSTDSDYPADLEVDYPERLNRGLVLIKSWLLAIPHYLIIAAVGSEAAHMLSATDYGDWVNATAISLLTILIATAEISLLFIGRYPIGIFEFTIGLNRWIWRVQTYAALMCDEYPPFRLDQGAREPVCVMREIEAAEPTAAERGNK